jgi:hypothetical protein
LTHLIQDFFLQRISSCLYISSSFLLMTLSSYCFVTMWHVCIIFFWRSSKFCSSVFLLERCSQRPLCSICKYVVWSVLYFDGSRTFWYPSEYLHWSTNFTLAFGSLGRWAKISQIWSVWAWEWLLYLSKTRKSSGLNPPSEECCTLPLVLLA